jgi:osmotically-inducible protein OsmY
VTLDGSAAVARLDMHLLSDDDPEQEVRTNNDGYYSFRRVCPGRHTVRPGPAWWENARLPSPYRPSSREVFVRVVEGSPAVITGINFEQTNPPGQGGPSGAGNFIKDQIKVDESVRAGRDMKLAREIEQFLEQTLPCKEHQCDLTIKVQNGRVTIAGVMQPNDKPLLNKVGEAIGGVRRLDISGVRSIEWTYRPGQQGTRDQGDSIKSTGSFQYLIKDHIRIDETSGSGSGDVRLAREIEQYLESTLPCKEHLCDLTIKVRNARVTITGTAGASDKSSLNKVGEAIGGVRRLDISGVRSKEQP